MKDIISYTGNIIHTLASFITDNKYDTQDIILFTTFGGKIVGEISYVGNKVEDEHSNANDTTVYCLNRIKYEVHESLKEIDNLCDITGTITLKDVTLDYNGMISHVPAMMVFVNQIVGFTFGKVEYHVR